VSVFISAWLGAVAIAVGGSLAAWQTIKLGRDRWGEPRVRVIALRRRGTGVRSGLMLVVYGLFILAGRVAPWSGWYWSVLVVWAAVLAWDTVIWLRASER
jgi:hypothetical protein